MNKLFSIVSILSIFMMLTSCDSGVYQEVIEIQNQELSATQSIDFMFDIEEDGNYNVFYVVRNDLNYPFYNMYFKSRFFANDKVLAEGLQEIDLFNSKTGKPYGKGLGDIFEHEFMAYKNQQLTKGTYQLSLKQYMREDKLKGVLSVGIVVRKSE